MNVLILGGGAQGKACLYDISKDHSIKSIKVVENDPSQINDFVQKLNDPRIEILQLDANNREVMLGLFRSCDIIIDLLPTIFRKHITELAIEAKTNIVNTSFQSHIKELDAGAKLANIIVMPESGLDPGIDLILGGHAVRSFDSIESFESNCGGFPVKKYCDNPINYKVSWTFEGVLSSYTRPASIILDGERIGIPSDKIFDYAELVHIPDVGMLERYPNGFSTTYAKLLGIRDDAQRVIRYTLRWPGHSLFWKKMVDLGLLDDSPVLGISPKKYLATVLSPKLQYKDDEQDMIVLRNEIIGMKGSERIKMVQQVIDTRDLGTGLMAMNRTVGFTASIIAQMIMKGKIKGSGVLNPAKDIPYEAFLKEIEARGVKISESSIRYDKK